MKKYKKQFKEMVKRISEYCKEISILYPELECPSCGINCECGEILYNMDSHESLNCVNSPDTWTEEDIELMWKVCKDAKKEDNNG